MPDIRPRWTLRCLTRFGISIASRSPRRRGLTRRLPLGHHVAAIDPDLHPDAAIRRVGVDLAIADVGAQRAERDPTVLVPFAPAHLGPAQATGDGDLHALRTGLHGALHGLLHGLLECDPPRQLLRDIAGDEDSVELRLADLLDLELHLAVRETADLLAQRLDVRTALADDDARLGGVDGDRDVIDATLDLD